MSRTPGVNDEAMSDHGPGCHDPECPEADAMNDDRHHPSCPCIECHPERWDPEPDPDYDDPDDI